MSYQSQTETEQERRDRLQQMAADNRGEGVQSASPPPTHERLVAMRAEMLRMALPADGCTAEETVERAAVYLDFVLNGYTKKEDDQ